MTTAPKIYKFVEQLVGKKRYADDQGDTAPKRFFQEPSPKNRTIKPYSRDSLAKRIARTKKYSKEHSQEHKALLEEELRLKKGKEKLDEKDEMLEQKQRELAQQEAALLAKQQQLARELEEKRKKEEQLVKEAAALEKEQEALFAKAFADSIQNNKEKTLEDISESTEQMVMDALQEKTLNELLKNQHEKELQQKLFHEQEARQRSLEEQLEKLAQQQERVKAQQEAQEAAQRKVQEDKINAEKLFQERVDSVFETQPVPPSTSIPLPKSNWSDFLGGVLPDDAPMPPVSSPESKSLWSSAEQFLQDHGYKMAGTAAGAYVAYKIYTWLTRIDKKKIHLKRPIHVHRKIKA
jgi:hypothetical protein